MAGRDVSSGHFAVSKKYLLVNTMPLGWWRGCKKLWFTTSLHLNKLSITAILIVIGDSVQGYIRIADGTIPDHSLGPYFDQKACVDIVCFTVHKKIKYNSWQNILCTSLIVCSSKIMFFFFKWMLVARQLSIWLVQIISLINLVIDYKKLI